MRYRPIRRNSEYGRVYARGKSYVNPALVLYVLKTRGKKTRVGLTATKKIGHAVQRNRARRASRAGSSAKWWPNSLHRPVCRTRPNSREPSPRPPFRRLKSRPRRNEPFAGMPERALRTHPILPALHQPRPWAQLPLFALVQPVHAGGHPDPWLPERAAAGRGPHRPVQSAGPLGLRPRPPEASTAWRAKRNGEVCFL